jgi:SAM-dependent methyltransferase
MDRIQRGYYGYEFVRDVVAQRVNAIRLVLPKRSRLIDLGCNDGTISNVLILSGYAASSIGVDFEDTRRWMLPEFSFVATDLRHFDVNSMAAVDVILCLNVVHHLCLNGLDFARSFMRSLSTKAGSVICDMGSLTATAAITSPWAKLMRSTWARDEDCWADLFRPFSWRRPLLTYPFQHGRRVLWKLATSIEPPYEYEVVAARGSVRKLRRAGTEEYFWAKSSPELASTAAHASRLMLAFLKDSPFDCLLPMQRHPTYGEIYPYDPEVENGVAVSFAGSRDLLPQDDYARVLGFASQEVPSFGNRPLHEVCEFKAVKTSRGVTFFGFAPCMLRVQREHSGTIGSSTALQVSLA